MCFKGTSNEKKQKKRKKHKINWEQRKEKESLENK